MPPGSYFTDVLGLASAAALLVLGLALVRLGHRSGPALLLGLFAAAWGGQVLTVRLAFLLGPGPASLALMRASWALALPLYLLLAHFAAVFPRRSPLADKAWWLPLLVVPAALALAALALDPASAVAGSGVEARWGWSMVMLAALPLLAAQVAALARFAAGFLRARAPAEREQLRLATLAMLLFLAYDVPYLLPTAADAALLALPDPLGTLYVMVVAGAGLAVLAVGLALLRPPGARSRATWGLALALPAASAWASPSTASDLLGLWRLAAAALLFYAVVRYRFLDAEVRLRSTAEPLALALVGVAAFAALGVGATLLGGQALAAQPWVGLAAAAGALALVVALRAPWARFLDARFPYIQAGEEYRARRRLEVYRAALAEGAGPRALAALRAELGLGPREAALLEATAPPRAPPAAARFAPRYRVEALLADGLYGRVLLARDERLGRPVVLKEYLGAAGPGAAASFAREAKLLAELEHPNVVRVTDVFRAGDDWVLATEHAPGGDLEGLLRRRPRLREEESLDLAEQVLEALAAAHRRGIVHRDVKPANVLLDGARVKLADFGVAQDPVLDAAFRASGAAPGTLAWMAPEQAAGRPATPATDVHAAGALLYRMLAGRPAVDVEGLGEGAARRALAARLPALPAPGVPPWLEPLLARALAKEPEARFPDAGAMLRDLRRARRSAGRAPSQAPAPSLMGPRADAAA